jgi:hypothetical protein
MRQNSRNSLPLRGIGPKAQEQAAQAIKDNYEKEMQPDDVMEQEESESAKAKLDEQEGR